MKPVVMFATAIAALAAALPAAAQFAKPEDAKTCKGCHDTYRAQ